MSQHEAVATMPTANASRYLQQLCEHWSHDLRVELTGQGGKIVFPNDFSGRIFPGEGIVVLNAQESALEVVVKASALDQLEALKEVVARHLGRLALRETPLSFEWHNVNQTWGGHDIAQFPSWLGPLI